MRFYPILGRLKKAASIGSQPTRAPSSGEARWSGTPDTPCVPLARLSALGASPGNPKYPWSYSYSSPALCSQGWKFQESTKVDIQLTDRISVTRQARYRAVRDNRAALVPSASA